jgi:hypothetical protein
MRDPDIRKSLAVSVVTSVLVLIFIDPVLKLVASWLMWLGANLSESWTNGIYKSASLGLREKFSFLVLGLLASVLAGVISGFTSARVSEWRRSKLAVGDTAQPVTPKVSRKSFVITIVGLVLFYASSLSVLASNFAELQLNASFNQRVTVVAAKATEQQTRELRAAWASMQTRKDYDAINAELDKIAAHHQVKLPAPLW